MEHINVVSIKDKNYPQQLKEIKNPPKFLYYKGEFIPKEPCFAIVGARLCSVYGKEVALEIAGGLADAGFTIVSGLAPGIDTASHQAIIEKGKRTIAVLGTGLDEKTIYPQSNLKLTQKILENNGCLISEYPAKTQGSRFTFPQRNRIISGLSIGVLVIEAKQKSGALITANWARMQGRKIFAVPGSIYSQNSKGCHYLIKQGAKLAENVQDIIKELKTQLKFTLNKEDKKSFTEQENLILNSLKEKSLHIDEIIEMTKLDAVIINRSLAVLEVKGKIRNLESDIYALMR